eukprot:GGOE01056984.1.p2 GENE.GGOE01056984.1~~GGOE01056984.1.p2  ORF type:complete len:183 (-),score=43.48 GGOE01056984.1:943-1416(-)
MGDSEEMGPGGVVDGLMRLVKGNRNNVSLSDLAKERTRNGLSSAMEVRCVTTFDVDGLLETPCSPPLGSPPRVVLEMATVTMTRTPPTLGPDHADSEASDRSQSFTIAHETLQLTRPRRDGASPHPLPPTAPPLTLPLEPAPSDGDRLSDTTLPPEE